MAGYLKNSVLIFDWVRLNTDTRHQLKIHKCVRYLLSSRKPKKKKPLKGAIECNQARNTKITNNYKAITLIFNCLLTNFQNITGEKTLLQRDSIRKFYLAVSANGDYQHNHHLSSCRRCVFCRISYSSPAGHLKENTNNEDMSQTRGERAGSGHMTATCWPCASRVTSSVGTPWGAVHGDCLQQRWQDGRTTFTHTHFYFCCQGWRR